MAYQRKTRDLFLLQANYGYGHGWEELAEETSREEIKQRLKEHRENAPEYPYRVIVKRERIESK